MCLCRTLRRLLRRWWELIRRPLHGSRQEWDLLFHLGGFDGFGNYTLRYSRDSSFQTTISCWLAQLWSAWLWSIFHDPHSEEQDCHIFHYSRFLLPPLLYFLCTFWLLLKLGAAYQQAPHWPASRPGETYQLRHFQQPCRYRIPTFKFQPLSWQRCPWACLVLCQQSRSPWGISPRKRGRTSVWTRTASSGSAHSQLREGRPRSHLQKSSAPQSSPQPFWRHCGS